MSLKNEFRVGVTCRKVAFGQDCKAILPTADIDARFLAYALRANSNNILRMVDEAGHGTGRLPTDQLAALRVGIPTLAEQRRVVEILDAVGDGIHAGTSYVAKLHVLWQGLMADLLTGRVQVKDAEELVEGEV
jgi:type I restriction enzyme S subunit